MDVITRQLLDKSAGTRYAAEAVLNKSSASLLAKMQAKGTNVSNLTTLVMNKINDIVVKSQGGL